LYRGPLLEGLSIDEPGFDEWLRIEQSRHHERATAALVQLAQSEEQAGELGAAVQVRLSLCRLSPWDEHNHRSLMLLYARDGRRSAALSHFRMCKEILQRELGVDPEPATLKLCQEIAGGEYAANARECEEPASGLRARPLQNSEPTAPARSVQPARPFVCREREIALLCARWARAAEGEASVATLIGEAGVGKTHILDELAREVRATRGHVLVGRCYESEQVLPFAPWVAALRAHPGLNDQALWAELPPTSRAVLTRIFARAEAPPEQLAPQDDVLHVFEGYLALLERLSRGAPLLLALDDMHWADDMSLRLFSFLGRRLAHGRGAPVLLLATLRKEELSRRALLHTSLGELARDQRALSLAVEPLSQEDTGVLLCALLPEGSATRELDVDGLVWQLSEGNPLVIVEAARALAAGALAVAGVDLPIPERVREVIAGHIARLSPFEQELTSLAAVVGREFELPLLCVMTERDVVTTGSAVEALVRAGVFKESGDKLYFSHARIREVVYAGLLPPRRAVLHAHVARTLLAVHAEFGSRADSRASTALPEMYGSLAFHFSRAGDRRSAVTYLAAFADHAAASFGIDEALAALAEASELARELASDERAVWLIELSLRRAKCLFHLGRFGEIAPCLAPHLPLLDALARPEL
jgi:tetratricopeptide (TPR) repeat protein